MADVIMKSTVAVALLLTAIQDFKYKKISIWIVALSGVVLIICIPFDTSDGFLYRVGGALVGIGMLLLSKVTQGKVGMGDGLILCITGIVLGFWTNIELLGIALFGAAVLSIFLLTFRLANRKQSIPFVPFMFVSYLILILAK